MKRLFMSLLVIIGLALTFTGAVAFATPTVVGPSDYMLHTLMIMVGMYFTICGLLLLEIER